MDSFIRDSSYTSLAKNFWKYKKDSIKAVSFARAYLRKSKKDFNVEKMADGYYFLSKSTKLETSLKYSDSIIELTENRSTKFLSLIHI